MIDRRLPFVAGLLFVASTTASVVHASSVAVGLRPGPPTGWQHRRRAPPRSARVTCHNQRLQSGGLALETVDTANMRPAPTSSKKSFASCAPAPCRLASGVPTRPRSIKPPRALETALDPGAALSPIRRLAHAPLNRAEYANAIRELLSLDVDVASLLPPDNSAYGFDNIAEALGVSPSLQERYLAAAETISALAVGDPHEGATSETYRIRQDLSQNQHVEGLPLGTVGGTLARHVFPLDGEYQFQAKLYRTNFDNVRGIEHPHQIDITIDGERIHSATIGGYNDLAAAFDKPTDTADAIDARLTVRVPVKAGPHEVSIVRRDLPGRGHHGCGPSSRAPDTLDWTGRLIFNSHHHGPLQRNGSGDTLSRRICTRRPVRNVRGVLREVRSFGAARRAYRRPSPTPTSSLIATLRGAARRRLKPASSGRRKGSGPKFVFRIEHDQPHAAPGRAGRVSDVELASRLPFFLWSGPPDDELLARAEAGTLGNPEMLERQVRRLLADPRAQALVSNFAGQWLQLRNVRSLAPNSDVFPDFDDNLRQAFRRETELFFESIMREDRSAVDLLSADYTFVNERLARHYGIPTIYGIRFHRVPPTDEARKGLLLTRVILPSTSHLRQTLAASRAQ